MNIIGHRNHTLRAALLIVAIAVMIPSSGQTQESIAYGKSGENWCGTDIRWKEKIAIDPLASPEACSQYGICDDPSYRGLWIPDGETPLVNVRLVVHLLRNDDGSNAISSDATALSQIDNLNYDYAAAGIQFVPTINHVNSTAWRTLSENEINAMKNATAIQPDSQLNMWVTQVDFGYSFGTFPWDNDALGNTGGIVVGSFHWTGSGNSVVAHEVGHCLGLMHTFNGVTEVTECGPCYEYVGAPDADLLGDRCDDTPPGPIYYNCGNTGGTDACSGEPWGYTMPENYMSYAPQWCYDTFTPKQQGRMRCWLDDHLSSWIEGVKFTATNTFGSAPLEVMFEATATRAVSSWSWDFGDGTGSGMQSPDHTYSEPGLYSVSVTAETDGGPYTSLQPELVAVHGDTMRVDSVQYVQGEPLTVEILVDNFISVQEILIPFGWAGPYDLTFDSATTAGLRTENFSYHTLLNYDFFNDRATILLRSTGSGVDPLLAPGSGPVLALHFTANEVSSGINPISFASYNGNEPGFVAPGGAYVPTLYNGAITFQPQAGCCDGPSVGNVDGSPDNIVTMGDLTVLIDHLFISLSPLLCTDEGNVDMTPDGLVTMGDLSVLIDHLFISLDPLSPCP